MGITIQNLDELDPTLVEQFDKTITQLITELDPTIDIKSGPCHDLVLHVKAILDAATQMNIDLIRQSNSLLEVTANPTLADNDIVDRLLSNYDLTRSPGTIASGNVTIVLSALISTVIPVGSTFTINGLTFVAPVTYIGRTSSGAVVGPNDRLITAFGSGQWSFTIGLNASAVGSGYNVSRATNVIPTNAPSSFVKAFVASDFTGGTDPSTNAELITQLSTGMAIQAWSNRVSIESLIRKQSIFAHIDSLSIIGFGDPEMLRDQHAIWPGSCGGRSDLYLRSQDVYQNIQVPKTAVLISKVGAIGTWQFGIGRDDAPGFYQVDRILLPGQDPTLSGFTPSSDVRSLDLTGVNGVPDLLPSRVVEGIYSRYQAAVIQFVDNITDATSLTVNVSTNAYNVIIRAMPLIADLQTFLLGRNVAPPMCDVLVKAPMPCYTSVSFTVNYNSATPAPTVAAIQVAIASAVNALVFPGQLSASFIDRTLHNLLGNLVSVTGMNLIGQIRSPDGTLITLHDSVQITIPNEPINMISGRTTAFLLPPANVGVTLVAVDVPNV